MDPAECCRLLGVQPPSLRGCTHFEQAQERLRAWKDGPLKRAYRRAAMDAHPDRGGTNERMQAVNAAYAKLRDELEIKRPTARVGRVVRMHSTGGGTSASTNVTGGWAGGSVHVTIVY